MSFVISLFVFLEVVDLVRDRIRYFAASDFYPAMLCCGIRESRIVNIEVLWKNSRAHLIHKLIAIFGSAIFLQCSIDFIISVGLSTDVSSTNFPVTLGSLLAKMDSKQDILAIGSLFGDLSVFGRLLTEHLQGVSVAVVIVFSLLCIYQISNGFVKRNSL
jgi:ABC-type dipeptide/oligopeptide/nickel transport system permease subunit